MNRFQHRCEMGTEQQENQIIWTRNNKLFGKTTFLYSDCRTLRPIIRGNRRKQPQNALHRSPVSQAASAASCKDAPNELQSAERKPTFSIGIPRTCTKRNIGESKRNESSSSKKQRVQFRTKHICALRTATCKFRFKLTVVPHVYVCGSFLLIL